MEKKYLEIINTTILKLFATANLQQLCEMIVDEVRNLITAEHGVIFLKERGKLERIFTTFPHDIKITVKKKGYLEKSFKTNNIIILENAEIQKIHPELEKSGIKSVTIIPLTYQKDTTGILVMFSKIKQQFMDKQLYIFKLYGSMIGLAITKTKLQEETSRALELRDRFISLASHELRTPLTSINGYIQLLYGKLAKKDTPESRWVEELNNEGARLTNLVKDLLDINRIKQGQLAFVLSEVNLKNIIDKAISEHKIRNSDHEIFFEDKIKDNKYFVIGDSEKLRDMVSALIGNAVKFSKPNSKITVILSRTTHAIRITIKDQGKGIPQKDLSKIFDGFYKTEHAREKEGMGVGLMLAKHVINHHRGKMNITSKENKGTTVEVTLPSARI